MPGMTTQRTPDTSRGQGTREALIQAALEIFGRDGFDAASTRAIADAAGANQALIGYHFGGKEGLYLAVFEHIADQLGERLGPVASSVRMQLQVLEDLEGDAQTRLEQYLAPLNLLTDTFTAVLAGEEAGSWARLILREQQSPSPAFELLYSRVMRPLTDVVARLMAGLVGAPHDSERIQLLVFTTLGQALVFRAARATVLHRLGWSGIGPDELRMIQQQIRRNVEAALRAEMER